MTYPRSCEVVHPPCGGQNTNYKSFRQIADSYPVTQEWSTASEDVESTQLACRFVRAVVCRAIPEAETVSLYNRRQQKSCRNSFPCFRHPYMSWCPRCLGIKRPLSKEINDQCPLWNVFSTFAFFPVQRLQRTMNDGGQFRPLEASRVPGSQESISTESSHEEKCSWYGVF